MEEIQVWEYFKGSLHSLLFWEVKRKAIRKAKLSNRNFLFNLLIFIIKILYIYLLNISSFRCPALLALLHGRLQWRVLQWSLRAEHHLGTATLLELRELHILRGCEVGKCPSCLQETGARRWDTRTGKCSQETPIEKFRETWIIVHPLHLHCCHSRVCGL